MDRFLLWVAQGFGAGWMPKAPGTAGSLVGLIWAALLFQTGSLFVYVVGTVAGICLSVPVCDRAEKILKQKDPGCVVFDEIIALPVCLLPLAWLHWDCLGGTLRSPAQFERLDWLAFAAAFGLFRLFDISKPFPVRQSQELPGGWGVTVDDVLAGVYTGIALVLLGIVAARFNV